MFLKVIIEGMHCNGCKLALERELNDDPEVIKATVNLEEQCAYLEVVDKIKLKRIEKIIKKAGFKCLDIKEEN